MTEISIKKEDLLQIGTDDCIKFDKLILRKTWRRKVASEQKCQSGVDVLNFHKIADCNKLFSYSQMCDLDLVWSRSLPCFSPYKFLWVRLGMLSVKLLSLSPAPCTSTPAPWRPPSSIPQRWWWWWWGSGLPDPSQKWPLWRCIILTSSRSKIQGPNRFNVTFLF